MHPAPVLRKAGFQLGVKTMFIKFYSGTTLTSDPAALFFFRIVELHSQLHWHS